MAKVEPSKDEIEKDAKEASRTGPKNPADAARAKLLKDGTVEDRRAEIAKLQAEIAELEKPPVQEYPKMKYHPEQPPMEVASAEQEEKLGDGWVDSYDDIPEVQERTKSKEKGAKDKDGASGPARVAHDEVAAGRGGVR